MSWPHPARSGRDSRLRHARSRNPHQHQLRPRARAGTVQRQHSGTKAYLLNLSLRLHQEVAGKGVRVQVVLPGATRTSIWEKAGTDIASLPPAIVMDVDDMVDAALSGLDLGETVTIPSLPDPAQWERYEAARQSMIPNLSLNSPAARYGIPVSRKS